MRIKLILCYFIFICIIVPFNLLAQDNKPAIIAQSLSVVYGVRSDAIQAIFRIYEKEGLGVSERKSRTERLLKSYSLVPEKVNGATALSNDTKTQLKVNSAVAEVLDWDLFARKNYLSTVGDNGPAVIAKGDVNIWYGIPPAAVRALADVLEKAKTSIADLDERLKSQVKKYEDLKADLEAFGPEDPLIKKSLQLLGEGKFTEVSALLDNTLNMEDKRVANLHFLDGGVKELLLKYDAAAAHYYKAVVLDPRNSKYMLSYSFNEDTRGHYDEAIAYYQKALAIDTVAFKDEPEKAALLYNNLGAAWDAKGKYDLAIDLYQKALAIDSVSLGYKHPAVARDYTNLGSVWNSKGKYERAITFFQKALGIDSTTLGNKSLRVATDLNNLGLAWYYKGKYDLAIGFYQKALIIDSMELGKMHPEVAIVLGNLGAAWDSKEDYDRAIDFYQMALGIDSVVLGIKHPRVATDFNNLGAAWNSKEKYDQAIDFYQKALIITSATFGDRHPRVAVLYNNLGAAWNSNEKYDRAIDFYQKALDIDSVSFGSKHPDVARDYNNLGSVWDSKEDYDKAIAFYEQALRIDTVALGYMHPRVALEFNNLGNAWVSKEEYDKAIACYQQSLNIDSTMFGNKNLDVARDFNSLGYVWNAIGNYNRAIDSYQKSLDIFRGLVGEDSMNIIVTAQALAYAANAHGTKLFKEKEYAAAIPYFKIALENAEVAEDLSFSITCLNNIGSSNKNLGNFVDGLSALEKGIARGEELAQIIDEQLKAYPAEQLNTPEVQDKIAELKNTPVILRMRYHKIGCLAGLSRNKEAEVLAKQVWKDAVAAKDMRTLDDLKKDGWIKE